MVNLPKDPKPNFSMDRSKPVLRSSKDQEKIVKEAVKLIRQNKKIIDSIINQSNANLP